MSTISADFTETIDSEWPRYQFRLVLPPLSAEVDRRNAVKISANEAARYGEENLLGKEEEEEEEEKKKQR